MTIVYCSGPAGLGVARSLREAFADLHLVGVGDAPGLHHPVFDDVWIRPEGTASEIVERLDAGAWWWVPGSESEARSLAGLAGRDPRLLSPSAAALERFDGPRDELARRLGIECPAAISAQEEDWQLSAFGREHGWRVSLRGPGQTAAPIGGWRAVERLRAQLGDRWAVTGMRLQADVDGAAEWVAFAAHRGVALGAAHVRATEHGGRVSGLAAAHPALAGALEAELAAGAWTGGGELELVRSIDGALWLIASRPRFGARVHGATLAGVNLPAALVGAATGLDPAPANVAAASIGASTRLDAAPAARQRAGFVQVVLEIPLRDGLPLLEPVTAAGNVVRAGNYLSGMPDPGRGGAVRPHPRAAPTPPDEALRAIVAGLRASERTPHAHAIDPAPRWERLAAAVRDAAAGTRVEIAYSIKTDPDLALLRAARASGFLAEAITEAEQARARDAGFDDGEVVLNGPAKSWPQPPSRAFAVYADSREELAALAGRARSGALAAQYLGPRLRPPSIASRFGVRLDDFATFREIVRTLRDLPASQEIGVHFHWASSEAGHETWFQTVEATLEWARRLQELSGRPIACFDLGGGWQPDDFDTVLLPRLGELLARCHAELDALDMVVIEPGRALVQPLAVVETTVLELRERDGVREIVVDAALAEVPRCVWYPHRLLSRGEDGWHHWGRGPDRVVGRLCMEDDVLRTGIAVPDDVRAGTRVFIADAGAYDRSMAYSFGRG